MQRAAAPAVKTCLKASEHGPALAPPTSSGLGQFVAAAAKAAPFTMLAPLMMTLCLTLTNGMVHHAALLRPGTRPAPMAPRMFDLGKSTGGGKGRSNQAGGSSKSAISGDSPFSPTVSQVPAANGASLRCILHRCVCPNHPTCC